MLVLALPDQIAVTGYVTIQVAHQSREIESVEASSWSRLVDIQTYKL